jgi:hypothetical protein
VLIVQQTMPGISLLIGAVVGTIGAVVVAPAVAPAALGVVGFSAAGPVAGSPLLSLHTTPLYLTHCTGTVAAGMQAGIGNVVAGSLFAGAQSVAMGGALPAIGSAIAGSLSGLGGWAVAAIVF